MTAYIADDEPLALAKLKLFLQRMSGVTVVGEFGDGASLLAALLAAAERSELPDLVVTDIQMPGMTGMEVIERLPAALPVIVTSAYEDYALPGFAQGVTDYLLKPYTPERLALAVRRAAEALRLRELDRRVNAPTLTVRAEGRNLRLAASDVLCLRAEGDYTAITLRPPQRPLLVLEGLSALAERLPRSDGGLSDESDGGTFVRVHRSYIVNGTYVIAVGRQSVTLEGGMEVPIGRTYRTQAARLSEKQSGARI